MNAFPFFSNRAGPSWRPRAAPETLLSDDCWEREEDWTDYGKIACDIYIQEGAPVGLEGKMSLTVGDSWKWVEMSRSFPLKPGQWVTMSANLKPGSIDWRRIQVDDAFRQDVRKIDIRVESNNKPAYTGPIYVDNIRVTE